MNKANQIIEQANSHFAIHTLQWLIENGDNQRNEINKQGYYEIIWVKNGSGLLITGSEDFEISNKIVYCLPSCHFRNIKPESNMEGYYVSLSADFFYKAETEFNFSFWSAGNQDSTSPVLIKMDEEIRNDAEEILLKMEKEFNNYFSLRLEILKGLFKIFLLYISRNFVARQRPATQTRDGILVKNFLLLLKSNFTTKKLVADYASELSVTPGYLNQVVKRISGFTASHHIQQSLVLEAKKQAIYSNRSMKEIAYGLGFDDTAHFSKFFKNISGVNFTNFKKESFYLKQY